MFYSGDFWGMHRIDLIGTSNLRFVTKLLIKQSACTIVICVYMGLQKCIKDTIDNVRESQV